MADFSFKKCYRLRSAQDFSLLKLDNKIFKKFPLVFYFKENSIATSRLGVSVSKKNGNSVFRNRIKRVIREHFRHSPFKNYSIDLLVVVNLSGDLKEDLMLASDRVLKALIFFENNYAKNV